MNMELKADAIIDSILSHNIFQDTDTKRLAAQYNNISALRKGNEMPFIITPLVQTGPNITAIPPQGLLINSPGEYQFTRDLEWNPANAGAAITIQSDGVVLDMGNFTLTVQAPPPVNSNQYVGISIENGAGIAVQNGCISGAGYYGIKATSVLGLALKQVQVSHMRYIVTNVPDLTPCGFFIDTCNEFIVESCQVQDISVTAPSCAGIQVLESTNGELLQCTMSGFLNNDGGVQGFSYIGSSQVLTQGCMAKNFQSHYMGLTKTTGHTVIGYVPIFCNDLMFKDCSAMSMTGCCDDCHGLSVFLDANVAVENFYAVDIIDGVAPVNTGAKATGLEVYGINVSVSNCTVENILAIRPQDRQSAGFSAWGAGISFSNCKATNVQVLDANRLPDITYGYGCGYGWAPDARFKTIGALLVNYDACAAIDCQVGFDSWSHIDSVWQNITTQNCAIPFLFQPKGATRVFTMDNCSESPSGMPESITITNLAMGNSFPAMQLKNQPESIPFPPVNTGSSWNVPRVSLPNLFAIQSGFQTEWWYYVGTAYTDSGMAFSIQVQILRATITAGMSVSANLAGIGWNTTGLSQYIFGQAYGLGASEYGPVTALGNALVVPPVSDANFTAAFSPLIAVTGQSNDFLQDFKQAGNSRYNFMYTGNSILGGMGSTYSLVGSGLGYLTSADNAATTPVDYSFSFVLVDQRGTVMEGVSGYVGPDMFPKDSNPGAPSSYECAQPLLQISNGTIVINDTVHKITKGNLWMDRQMVAAANSGPEGSAMGMATPANADDLKNMMATQAVASKALYRGDWMGVTLNNGVSMALAEFWQPSNPQWITGTKVGLPPQNGFGNLFFSTSQNATPVSNGGRQLKPRLSLTDDEPWDFDINILEPGEGNNSPHWHSPLTGQRYATAWELEFAPHMQQYGVPEKLYVYALCENCENVMPMKLNAYFEGTAMAYTDKEQTNMVGHVFVEQMGFN
jgi:hypothetical protein